MITLLYEKTLKQLMVDKKIDDEEAQELKKNFCHNLGKRVDIMKKNTQFRVEDVFGDIISKDSILPDQIIKLINFLANYFRIIIFVVKKTKVIYTYKE